MCVTAIVVLTGNAMASRDRSPVTQSSPMLRERSRIPLPGVGGRIDHLAFDPAHERLFVAAIGNDTVEVVDTVKNTRLASLTGFHEPQGAALVPELSSVAIANGGTGTLQLIDAAALTTRWTIAIGADADNVRFDAAAKRLYVAAEGGLYAVDPAAGRVVGKIPFSGHPESFQLESGSTRAFANLPGLLHSTIVVSDRATMGVTAQWPTQDCGGNYPMAMDEASHRLFVGCRRPARLAMVDTTSGAFLSATDIVADTDDVFYDGTRKRVYVIGGEGFVDVLSRNGDHMDRVDRIPTRGGARTGVWVPAQGRLYVAVPARGGLTAEIRVFDVAPASR
jgi:DNA-binding beta-propeller fold protein YncE